MNISNNGIDLIKDFEGCYLYAYRCPANVWTIGFGHTGSVDGIPIKEGMFIKKDRAEQLLIETLNKRYEPAVRKFKNLNQNQYDALVSFCYNLGPGIFKGKLLTDINNSNWNAVTRQMLLYNKARVNGELKELPGLTRRREAEVALFKKEVDEVVKKIKISLNGQVKQVEAIEKDNSNYVKLQDLRCNKIDIGYDKMPIIKVK